MPLITDESLTPDEERIPSIDIQNLSVRIPAPGHRGRFHGRGHADRGWVHANTDISLTVCPGEVHAVIGESGCGKSIIANTVVGTVPSSAHVEGTVIVQESSPSPGWSQDMVAYHHAKHGDWRDKPSPLAGHHVGLIPQSAATFLTPVRTVGSQLLETITELTPSADAPQKIETLLDQVHLPNRVANLYPHELSGGMAQRVAVAFALAGDPEVVIADEPTASLDPELKSSLFSLLRDIADADRAVLLITHDVTELREAAIANRLSVMYASRFVEQGAASTILDHPHDPYTRALLAALPSGGMVPIPGFPPSLVDLDDSVTFESRLKEAEELSTASHDASPTSHDDGSSASRESSPAELASERKMHPKVWEGSKITKSFSGKKASIPVLNQLDISIHSGEIVGLAGPSGSGKTTLARIMCGLLDADHGTVTCGGEEIRNITSVIGGRRQARGKINMLFQSPRKACNPRFTLRQIIEETSHGMTAGEAAMEVQVTPDLLDRRPSQVSDGQLQRAILARVLASEPDFVVCDEVTAMLDPGTAAHTMTMLTSWARDGGIGILIISHSPELLRTCCDRQIHIESLAQSHD
ncbi:ABC transporter ATP-binding protein [Corynebacterium sp. L24]|uniref:ABC transporter ATP-binding protein n=1 Tax=Corynebacterium parakroppenstedtii TaxID=2828363 RepID=UPI001C8F9A2B|nr:ATP-binding cassette domain-containing protein [Corynebacterium parakroppenstedtii]MBY0794961.1 ABC transporter ATP-binding protein [Corynebacterium parakroppenstedtii]